jgi:phosphoribosylanthranilate isomerase
MIMVDVKICGISSLADYQICRSAGARWVGMVYYPGSPRHLDSAALAGLADQIDQLDDDDSDGDSGGGPQRVLLSVDESEASLRQLIAAARPDYLQLHGTETVAFASAMKAEFNLPIIKMIPIATAADLANCAAWDSIADWLIFDAKTDPGTQPGGTGHSFDWQILSHYSGRRPWMLAGGLTAGTVADAVRISGARAVDVSSGVERARGKKDENKIHAFIQAAQIG